MFEKGDLDILWLLKSAERNRKYIDINVDLTNGLMGKRVLFVPRFHKNKYAQVKTLDDFRKLNSVGAFGANWFDEKVWLANRLPYIVVDGEWRSIFGRLSNFRSDRAALPFGYFSRSVTEIGLEAQHFPELAIEPHLLFSYDRDFHFYIHPDMAHLKPIFEKALRKARDTGLMDKLINKHFSKQLKSLNLNQRTSIVLKTPN